MDTTMKHGALSTPLKSQLNTATKWSIALSIVMIIAGGFAIGLPQVTGIAVGALIAGLLLFSGFVHLAFGWQNRTTTGVIWEYLLGLVSASAFIW